jgi:Cdc6-like AAA superfamily ATPase
MKIILLSGKPDSGKTSTMHLVYNKITKKVIQKKDYINKNKDFESVVEYKNKKVAICSGGDYLCYCREKIIEYTNVDYLIIGYSDKFSDSLADKISEYSHHCVIKKTLAVKNLQLQANKKDCNNIISHIK